MTTDSTKFPRIQSHGLVYEAVNKRNGKRYIGATSKTLEHRKRQHSYCASRMSHNGAFYAAIRKYGMDSFEWRVISTHETTLEAAAEEKRLISLMNPDYNSTPGGLGFHKRELSKESRQRMSDRKKGKPTGRATIHSLEALEKIAAANRGRPGYWRGKQLPAHVVEMIRDRGKARIDKDYVLSLGPRSLRKRVVCLNDSAVYDSSKEAAIAYGVNRNAVASVCARKRKQAGGLVFRYFGDHHGGLDEAMAIRTAVHDARRQSATIARKNIVNSAHRSKRVLNPDDGMVFDSVRAAAKHYGKSEVTISEICQGKRQGRNRKQLRLSFADEVCHGA